MAPAIGTVAAPNAASGAVRKSTLKAWPPERTPPRAVIGSWRGRLPSKLVISNSAAEVPSLRQLPTMRPMPRWPMPSKVTDGSPLPAGRVKMGAQFGRPSARCTRLSSRRSPLTSSSATAPRSSAARSMRARGRMPRASVAPVPPPGSATTSASALSVATRPVRMLSRPSSRVGKPKAVLSARSSGGRRKSAEISTPLKNAAAPAAITITAASKAMPSARSIRRPG